MAANEINLEDPIVKRVVHALARRMQRPGIEREDLIQQGYLGLLSTRQRFDPAKCSWGQWVWQRVFAAMDDYRELHQHKMQFAGFDEDRDWPADEAPEPSPELVSLLRTLSDVEAETFTLICGMDGSPPRSCWDVALMLARGPSAPDLYGLNVASGTINKRYRRAVAKLRTRIEQAQLNASTTSHA